MRWTVAAQQALVVIVIGGITVMNYNSIHTLIIFLTLIAHLDLKTVK